ncbi:MAG: hypothetical protein N3D11_08475 [Candidatus Sumerlaeia bacterium]|nr:hypothetical protein [Candidatus Sumerlaeia bacterium]
MSHPIALSDLEGIAAKLAIPIRYEKGEMRGGLCRLRDRWQIIINAELNDEEKADVLAESLAQMNLDAVFIPPRIRQMLEQVKAGEKKG